MFPASFKLCLTCTSSALLQVHDDTSNIDLGCFSQALAQHKLMVHQTHLRLFMPGHPCSRCALIISSPYCCLLFLQTSSGTGPCLLHVARHLVILTALSMQALHGISTLLVPAAKDAVFSSPQALPTLVRLMLWPTYSPSKHGPIPGDQEQGPWHIQQMLSQAFSPKPSLLRSNGHIHVHSSNRAWMAAQIDPAANVAEAHPGTNAPMRQPVPQVNEKPAKAPKQQRQRAEWLCKQYTLRFAVAAQHAAAVLQASRKPLPGLHAHLAELVAAAMGAGEGLAGGLSIAESASHLLLHMRSFIL